MSLTNYVMMPGEDYQATCDAIRRKTGSTEVITSGELAGKISSFQLSGENPFQYATNADFLFSNATFPEGYELTINMPNFRETANRLVRYAKGLKKFTLVGNINKNSAGYQYFVQGSDVEIVDATQWGEGGFKPTYANHMFAGQKLHTILGEIDMSICANTNGMFADAYKLVDVRFKPNTISKSFGFPNSQLLSVDTIQSAFDGLADLTGSDTQTITFHTNVQIKTSQKQQAIDKNWTVVGGTEVEG